MVSHRCNGETWNARSIAIAPAAGSLPRQVIVLGSALMVALASCTDSPSASDSKAPPSKPMPSAPMASPPDLTGPLPARVAVPLPAACDNKAPSPGPTPLRRLNHFEYHNTIKDLLGVDSDAANLFPADERIGGFDNNAEALSVGPLLADQYMVAAEQIAVRALASNPALVPCDLKAGDEACARAFITAFGRRAWRRPLTSDEIGRLLTVFGTGKDVDPFASRIQLVIQALLTSPHFLYRVELGAPGGQGLARPTSHEMATRLSYFLWGSMPDETLAKLADSGMLETDEAIEAQARRMLDDERARKVVGRFHEQWLEVDRIAGAEKDGKIYPGFSAELLLLFKAEAQAFLENVLWDGDGDVSKLFVADFTFANNKLASFYGLPTPGSKEFARVALDTTRRSGFLTQGGIMTVLAKPNQTDPVARGLFVREMLLCDPPPPPPNDIDIKPPDPSPLASTRQRFTEHRENVACRACHQMMDPIGLGFEHFDGIGAWRELDARQPIDARGEIVGTDVEGPFDGAIHLSRKLARSQRVDACIATQWFRFAHGRNPLAPDECSLGRAITALSRTGNIRDLLTAMAKTDAFRYYAQSGEAP